MRKFDNSIWAIISNLEYKGDPDMWDCIHNETWNKVMDNIDTSIDRIKQKGVNHYEN